MNRIKVTLAKERILKLQEKYSKNINEGAKSSSDSSISVKSDSSVDQEQSLLNKNPIFGKLGPKNTLDDLPIKREEEKILEVVSSDERIPKVDIEFYDVTPKVSQESKTEVSEQFVEKSVSSGSLVLSDLSNQLERIRFISSSSENLSSSKSIDCNTKSISSNIVPSVRITEQVENSNKVTEDPEVKENSKTLQITEIKPSPTSLSKSELYDSSKISSIEEVINSESKTNPITYHDESISDNSKDSFVYDTSTKLIENINFCGLQEKSLISESNKSFPILSGKESSMGINDAGSKLTVQSTKSNSASTNSKMCRSSNTSVKYQGESERDDCVNKIPKYKTSPKASNAVDKTNKCINYANRSTNTDPVKVTLFKNRSEPHQHKTVVRSGRKSEKYKHRKNTEFSVKQKRPFIKPCNLIHINHLRNVESRNNTQQKSNSSKYNLTYNFYDSPVTVANHAMNCDDIITQLLKNQIQLTRHFMESHQEMYLQVCQAAQLLNEK